MVDDEKKTEDLENFIWKNLEKKDLIIYACIMRKDGKPAVCLLL